MKKAGSGIRIALRRTLKMRDNKEGEDMLGLKVRIGRKLQEQSGIGVVEMILILVVLIGLVLIFKDQLTTLVNNIFQTITEEAGKV